ncbi:MAG: cytochrome C oxidase subunit IV family protein [Actinobacteria bacterium]|nr:cytochrome C oxidase subunit IV family protein [Actinomycetota bacterium]
MSTDTAIADHGTAQEHEGDHLTFTGAIKIAILLAVITGVETATYFVDFGSVAEPLILILMAVKFLIVIGYFMHLKYDNNMFALLFAIGVVFALAVYGAMLLTFNFF